MRTGVIIVAGGYGERMKSTIPKQFLKLGEKPIIIHTVERFLNTFTDLFVSVALSHEYWEYWFEHCSIHLTAEQNRRISLARGGETRTMTVWNALQTYRLLRLSDLNMNEMSLLAIHDAVRPFVSVEHIRKCFQLAQDLKAVVSGVPVINSLRKKISTDITLSRTEFVERSDYWEVHTPQVFDFFSLWSAYEKRKHNNYTDDASLFESYYGDKIIINMAEGESTNIKITTPEDYEYCKWKISKKETE